MTNGETSEMSYNSGATKQRILVENELSISKFQPFVEVLILTICAQRL